MFSEQGGRRADLWLVGTSQSSAGYDGAEGPSWAF